MKKVLSIAASDPSGGAGIEADLKVFAAHGVFGMSAVTGITVQGPKGIKKIIPTPLRDFSMILEIIAEQTPPDAVKVGALLSAGHVRAVRKFLLRRKIPTVLDPLLKSGRGFPLLARNAWKELVSLFELVELVTPNAPEAEMLAGVRIRTKRDAFKAMEILMLLGADAVLLKGGHLKGGPQDILWSEDDFQIFRKKRLAGPFHGTGCAISSAIAANLAKGLGLEQSVAKAEKYMDRALKFAVEINGVKYLTHV